MDNKLIYVAAALVAVIVIAAAAVIIHGNDSKDSNIDDYDGIKTDFAYSSDVRLAIFGNANGDDYLDEKDVSTIENIIKGVIDYNPKLNCFADTNADGVIDYKDVELLKKFLNKEEATMYYWSNQYKIDSINYPLTGTIASHHVYPLDACIILGLYDQVVGMTNQGYSNSIGKDPTRYPGINDKVANIGVPEEDPSKLFNSGASVFIAPASSKDYTKAVDMYKAAGKELQIVRLCMSQYYPDCADLYGSMLMLGVMFQKEEAAQKYVSFVDGMLDYVNDSQKDLEAFRFITPYDITDTTCELDSSIANGSMMGDVYTISKLPMTSTNVVTTNNYCPEVKLETIIDLNPEVIVIITFHTYAWTVEEHQAELQELAEHFKGTNAYDNGRIYSVNYYNIANYGGIPQLALLASYIWPDAFSSETGWNYLQEYYSNYTAYDNPNVKEMGNAIPYKWEKP